MNTFNERDGLILINQMIEQARHNFQKGSGTNIIFWGGLIASLAILNWILFNTLPNPNHAYWVWCLTFPAFIIDFYITKSNRQKAKVKTHFDSIVSAIWDGFYISAILLQVFFWTQVLLYGKYNGFAFTTPIIMLMVGMGLFIMAKTGKFKPLLYSAVIFWMGSFGCSLLANPNDYFLVLAFCMLAGFVLPGYLINKKMSNVPES